MAEITIGKGDTLSGIATKYGTTVESLAKDNNIADPNKIQAGAKLTVNAGTVDNVEAVVKEDSPRPSRKPNIEPKPDSPRPKVKPNPNGPMGDIEAFFGGFLSKEKQDDSSPNSYHFFSEVLGIEVDHAKLAAQQASIAMAEKIADAIGVPLPDSFKPEITQEDFSPAVLSSIRDAAIKAIKRDRPTIYEDYNAANLTDSRKRNALGRINLMKEIGKSFIDPAMSAGLSIGQSSGLEVDENGDLWIKNDVYDFPDLSEVKGDDHWLSLNNLFGPEGIFSVRPENSRKININLGKMVKEEKNEPKKSG